MDSPTKKQWGKGPWQNEPDSLEWVDESTGLKCKLLRGPVGSLCGYVGVPAPHPANGLHYDGCTVAEAKKRHEHFMREVRRVKGNIHDWQPLPDRDYEPVPGIGEAITKIEVHGGLTYANGDEDTWWFGFDCAHAGDLCPGSDALIHRIHINDGDTKKWEEGRKLFKEGPHRDVYRDLAYVQAECASLARQLKGLERPVYAPQSKPSSTR